MNHFLFTLLTRCKITSGHLGRIIFIMLWGGGIFLPAAQAEEELSLLDLERKHIEKLTWQNKDDVQQYRNHLEDLEKKLLHQNPAIPCEIVELKNPFPKDSLLHKTWVGHHELRIKPGDETPLNILAKKVYPYIIAYVPIEILWNNRNYSLERHIFKVKNRLKRCYIMAHSLNDGAGLAAQEFVQQSVALIQQQGLLPLASKTIHNFFLNYPAQKKKTLNQETMMPTLEDASHSRWPFAHTVLDHAQNIYVPHRAHLETHWKIPGVRMHNIDNYRAIKRIGKRAEKLLAQISSGQGDPAGLQFEIKFLIGRYFKLFKTFTWQLLDLNAMLYILLHHPDRVYYLRPELRPNDIKMFVNLRPKIRDNYYVLELPWDQTMPVPLPGSSRIMLQTPEFQMFYRYNQDLFYRMRDIIPFINKLTPENPLTSKFLQSLIDLDQRPNILAEEVQQNIWPPETFIQSLGQSQKDAIESAKLFIDNLIRHSTPCAHNFIPPQAAANPGDAL